MINLKESIEKAYHLFCGVSGESNFAGTQFACARPRGHKGKHDFRPLWETTSTIHRLVELGFRIEVATLRGET